MCVFDFDKPFPLLKACISEPRLCFLGFISLWRVVDARDACPAYSLHKRGLATAAAVDAVDRRMQVCSACPRASRSA